MADETKVTPTEGAGVQNAPEAAEVPKPMSFDEMLKTNPAYQAELDRRIAKGIDTAKSKFSDPAVKELQKQLDGYIRRESAIKAGVDAKFLKFVCSEVSDGIADGATFDDALKAYLEANPQFVAAESAAPTKPAAGWGQPQTGKGEEQQMDGVEAAFRRLNPRMKF